ncbi:ribosome recycling factor domain-containing protein [Armillaria mellea]|nr:ribosome recycling factor domain-containing protein [Armillaria mellea]
MQTPSLLYTSAISSALPRRTNGQTLNTASRSTNTPFPMAKLRQESPGNIGLTTRFPEKMKSIVEWLRRDCADASAHQKLEQVATVGVRDGSMLVVTVFDEDNLKHVKAAIYDAKLPSITPQRQDTRTLRILVPKPTLDAKSSVVAAAGKKAEEARVQCRKLHQTSVKNGKYEKRSVDLEVFQDLLDKYVAEIDKILADMKKTLGIPR